jgi:beta-N-acetylhexosaminidase
MAVTAGTDLICLGREQDHEVFLAVKAALVEAVQAGRLPGARLEEAAARVTELREWAAAAAAYLSDGRAQGRHALADIGLAAARRAVIVDGQRPVLRRPLIVQLVPPSNLAGGPVPWGLRPFVPADSFRQVSTATPAGEVSDQVSGLLADADGRSLVIVVRDAHRHAVARQVVQLLLAGRPDAVVVEMGLPVWRPGARSYLASFGAGHSNSRATAEILGLIAGA